MSALVLESTRAVTIIVRHIHITNLQAPAGTDTKMERNDPGAKKDLILDRAKIVQVSGWIASDDPGHHLRLLIRRNCWKLHVKTQ